MKEQELVQAGYSLIWHNPSDAHFKCLLRKRVTGDNGEVLYCLDIYAYALSDTFCYNVEMFRQDQTAFRIVGAVIGSVEKMEEQINKMYIDLKCVPNIHYNKEREIKILPLHSN